jgi:hypothetical protein
MVRLNQDRKQPSSALHFRLDPSGGVSSVEDYQVWRWWSVTT